MKNLKIKLKNKYNYNLSQRFNNDVYYRSLNKKDDSAITLITLVITIIVMLILAGITVSSITGNNSIISRTKKSAIVSEFSKYNEEVELYKTSKMLENEDFYVESLTSGKDSLTYNTQTDEEKQGEPSIRTIIPDIKEEYLENFEIIKGELLFKSQDDTLLLLAQNVGISINPYNIVNGELKSSDNNLMLMDSQGNLTLPDTVTSIGEGTFSNVNGLKNIVIPYTCKEIKKNAFAYNSELESVTFQTKVLDDGTVEGCTSIGESAFRQTNLSSIELPPTITNIDKIAFEQCNLTSIDIPENLSSIREYVFCSNPLQEINFKGNKLTSIGEHAFSSAQISTINIPDKLKKIAPNAFEQCDYLENIQIDKDNKYFEFDNGMLIQKASNDKNVILVLKKYYENKSEMSIPDGVTIFNASISNLEISKLIIPSSVKSLSNFGNDFASSISDVTITNNENFTVYEKCIYTHDLSKLIFCFSKETNILLNNKKLKEIGGFAFWGATKATYVKLPDSVTTLGYRIAKNPGDSIKTIEIGSKVQTIDKPFSQRYDLTLKISNDNPYFMVENNILYSKNKDTIYAVLYRIQGEFKMSKGVKIIKSLCFDSQKQMTKLILNDEIEKIEDQAFVWCNITELNIPSSIKTMGSRALYGATQLSKVTINKKEGEIAGAPWGLPSAERGIIYAG